MSREINLPNCESEVLNRYHAGAPVYIVVMSISVIIHLIDIAGGRILMLTVNHKIIMMKRTKALIDLSQQKYLDPLLFALLYSF